MKTLLFAILVSLSQVSLASADDWFCKEQASRRDGDTVYACGMGKAQDETQARALAFKAAQAEFSSVCGGSSDCAHHQTIVYPGRTTCSASAAGSTCYRMVSYKIIPDAPKPVAQPVKSLVIAQVGPYDIECAPGCSPQDQSSCDWPGAMWKLKHGCLAQ